MIRTAVVDSGLCNIDSIVRALRDVGASTVVTSTPDALRSSDRLVIPGVGAFPDAMAVLRHNGLDAEIRAFVATGKPVLGVCLGMQLLATRGTEVAPTEGLGLIEGEVIRINPLPGERIPHVGWNEVNPTREHPLFHGIPDGTDFYFVHSYHFVPATPGVALAVTPFAGGITAAVQHHNVLGVQFHPEKSQACGRRLLEAFVKQ